jgi:gas vesicle protein
MAQHPPPNGLDDRAILAGFLVGLLVGGLVGLFNIPKNSSSLRQRFANVGQAVRGKLENVTPSDAVADSIAEGKAAARRRLEELGLNKNAVVRC